MHIIALRNILLCPITSMNINIMCYFIISCINGPFVFLEVLARGGICKCICFSHYFSNILQSNNSLHTNCILMCVCVCVSLGVAEIKDDLPLNLKV